MLIFGDVRVLLEYLDLLFFLVVGVLQFLFCLVGGGVLWFLFRLVVLVLSFRFCFDWLLVCLGGALEFCVSDLFGAVASPGVAVCNQFL